MPEARPGVLITRPEPGASETAARLTELGFQPVIAPLLTIRLLPVALPPVNHLQAILVTSGNGIAALPAGYRRLPLLAVGDATASHARTAGFAQVSSADGDASALAIMAARTCDPQGAALLLVSGRGQGMALATELRSRGFRIIRRAVYAAIPVPVLPSAAQAALAAGTLAAALFFSTETARHCVNLLRRTRLQEAVRTTDALAIGQPAAVALHALPWRRIRVAARPNQDAMLALLR